MLAGSLLVPMLVLADSSSSSSVSSSSSSSVSSSSSARSYSSEGNRGRRKTIQPIVAGCIQTAVDAREESVLAAVTSYTSSVVSAFQTKKTALHAAWAISDNAQRKAAVKTAWATFAQSKKAAKQTYKTARQTAWSNFQKAAKQCSESMSDEMYKANEDL